MSNKELLQTYKGQQVVENSFRTLKAPQVASVIYLKDERRIQALSMLLTFSLLIRALIQFKLRQGLKKLEKKEFEEKGIELNLKVGWGGKKLTAPTFKMLYEYTVNCFFEKEPEGEYSFTWPSKKTEFRVTTLLRLMELDVIDLLQ